MNSTAVVGLEAASIPDAWGLAASVVLVLVAAAVSLRARLGLTREILIAAVRAFVQLLAVGALLTVLFARAGVLGALLWVAGMVVVAAWVAGGRAPGLPRARLVAGIAIGIATASTVGVLLVLGVIDPQPLVVVPIGGMVVNGAMTATTLTLTRLVDAAVDQRADIEARLALGLTADAAYAPHARRAIKGALLPAIDSTKVVGLIALPGAMTGLILAGVEPLEAVRYQIVVMYMLLAASALGAIIAARLGQARLFDHADRLVVTARN